MGCFFLFRLFNVLMWSGTGGEASGGGVGFEPAHSCAAAADSHGYRPPAEPHLRADSHTLPSVLMEGAGLEWEEPVRGCLSLRLRLPGLLSPPAVLGHVSHRLFYCLPS